MAKRNAQGAGSIRQHSDGKWEARYTTGRDPGTGKQIQKSVYGKTQADVRKKLALATVALDEGIYVEPSRLTVGAWLDTWLDEYISNSVKSSTLHNYRKCCKTYLKPNLAAIKLSALNAPTIQKMINALQADEDGRKGLAPKTVKNIHGVLHKALHQAVELGFIRVNPADACKLPRITKRKLSRSTRNKFLILLKQSEGMNLKRCTCLLCSQECGNRNVLDCVGSAWISQTAQLQYAPNFCGITLTADIVLTKPPRTTRFVK
jgi:hypothetical protein